MSRFDEHRQGALAPPDLRRGIVVRPRVEEALDRGWDAALTLVVAPAGYGKTVAVETWVADRRHVAAWVGLDPCDNDPVRLWASVASSIERVRPGAGRDALQRLQDPAGLARPGLEALVAALAGDGRPLVLALDEVQLVTNERCLRSLDVAIEALPASVCLIPISRTVPPLRVARLRTQRRLVEVRMAELAFTPGEARELFAAVDGPSLDDAGMRTVFARTGAPARARALEPAGDGDRRPPGLVPLPQPPARVPARRAGRGHRDRPARPGAGVVDRAWADRGRGRVRAGRGRLGGTRGAGRGAPVHAPAHRTRRDARALDGGAPARHAARAPRRARGRSRRRAHRRAPGARDPQAARARADDRERRMDLWRPPARARQLHRRPRRRGRPGGRGRRRAGARRDAGAAGHGARGPRAHAVAGGRRRGGGRVGAVGARASRRARAAVRLHRRGGHAGGPGREARPADRRSLARRPGSGDDARGEPQRPLVGLVRSARRRRHGGARRAVRARPGRGRAGGAESDRRRRVAGVDAARARRDPDPPRSHRGRRALTRPRRRAARRGARRGRLPALAAELRRALDGGPCAGHGDAGRASLRGRALGAAAAAGLHRA